MKYRPCHTYARSTTSYIQQQQQQSCLLIGSLPVWLKWEPLFFSLFAWLFFRFVFRSVFHAVFHFVFHLNRETLSRRSFDNSFWLGNAIHVIQLFFFYSFILTATKWKASNERWAAVNNKKEANLSYLHNLATIERCSVSLTHTVLYYYFHCDDI